MVLEEISIFRCHIFHFDDVLRFSGSRTESLLPIKKECVLFLKFLPRCSVNITKYLSLCLTG
jgi:hypothetical protein